MVAVAQLVEPWIVIPVVVGSSPISHPIVFKQKAHLFEVGFLLEKMIDCGLQNNADSLTAQCILQLSYGIFATSLFPPASGL